MNVQGEEVKHLDKLANDLFTNLLSSSYTTALMVSEESEHIIYVIKSSNENIGNKFAILYVL